jgi:hypothetical protein
VEKVEREKNKRLFGKYLMVVGTILIVMPVIYTIVSFFDILDISKNDVRVLGFLLYVFFGSCGTAIIWMAGDMLGVWNHENDTENNEESS